MKFKWPSGHFLIDMMMKVDKVKSSTKEIRDMTIGSKEHEEIIAMFEKEYLHLDLTKLPKTVWSKGKIFQNEMTNMLFIAYRRGVAFGKVL